MRLKIEIIADDALGQFEELKKTCELYKNDKNAFNNVMEETWRKQLLNAGLKPISVKISVVG